MRNFLILNLVLRKEPARLLKVTHRKVLHWCSSMPKYTAKRNVFFVQLFFKYVSLENVAYNFDANSQDKHFQVNTLGKLS